jgi:NAD(P)-dependent dehydrogenase (short-subunit alcohol dehydrogenase family)
MHKPCIQLLDNATYLCLHANKMSLEITRPTRSLKGRVTIVTGAGAAAGGISNGRASAVLLAEDGCAVVCVDLKKDLAQETVHTIEEEGLGSGIAVEADVTLSEDCKRVVETAISKYGRLGILVNNVGVLSAKGTAVTVKMTAFMKGLELNVASMVQMAKYSIPEMSKNERQWAGSIVNMSSITGLKGGMPKILFPTSKGTFVNMTHAMAINHAPDRVRVNCVCPGG